MHLIQVLGYFLSILSPDVMFSRLLLDLSLAWLLEVHPVYVTQC